ncbi:MAG: BamA/TamA family outer membrane protein [Candidatus Eisenbacteria bacterium]|nr:BamA/TamA family outer membrane protein [Candidatus Eisenbacteria bacterium]
MAGRRTRGLLLLYLVCGSVLAAATGAFAAAEESGDGLIVEAIEVTGNDRTKESTIWAALGLEPGESVPPDSLPRAIENLRESEIFADVDVSSRRGSERGRIVLIVDAKEKPVEWRFGAGYQDLSGWYLIPVEFRADNRLGNGERVRAQVVIGNRMSGATFRYEEPRFGDRKSYYGLYGSAIGYGRIYFLNGVEYQHSVARGGFELYGGREIRSRLTLEAGAGFEAAEVESVAEAWNDRETRGIETGDELAYEDLPPEIRADVGERVRGTARLDLIWDNRSERLVAATPAAGVWGRLRVGGVFDHDKGFPYSTADVRAYRSAGGLSFGARLRAGVTTPRAPWFDRFYVGGLFTVRGFPTQSLSVTEGETRFWSASLEMRGALVGDRANPRLAGLLFIDAGDGWIVDGEPTWGDVAIGAGYGLRCRLPWVGWIGLDVGVPLTDTPAKESYHINGSFGWTF